jgi:uncharacterized protein YdeI (BOF family)
MLTKTKLAFAAALLVGTASVAAAQGEYDGNLANRYPAYNGPVATQGTFQSAPVALRGHSRGHIRNNGPVDESAVDGADHASSPYSGF